MIKTGLIWTAGAIAVMAGILFWAWGAVPDGQPIPVHWNASGEADSFKPRSEALIYLLILPASALFTSLLMALAPSLDPFKDNLRKSAKAYVAIWAGILLLMTFLTGGIAYMMVRGAQDGETSNDFIRFVLAACGILFIVIGNYLPKTRKTFFIGIRTPWTLTSDYTWEKTHRLVGPLYILAGLIGIIAAFTMSGIALVITFVGAVLSVSLFGVIYSWWVWRHANDRNEGSDYIV
ncbi:SdpI family protein [Henriciella litoralis]|uniref:SdpI family protein n=1 Tax=Henriciella litoralis TaxID=568102 RepID=UPI000A010AEA|nr:SdpI family protein [Henriciella litoralis]